MRARVDADALLALFRRHDKHRRGALHPGAFGRALTEAGFMLTGQELDLLLQKYTSLLAPDDVAYQQLVQALRANPALGVPQGCVLALLRFFCFFCAFAVALFRCVRLSLTSFLFAF